MGSRSHKIKFTDKRWIVRKGKSSWLIKQPKARVEWLGNTPRDIEETTANVNLIKNAPRLYHCVEKILEAFQEHDMRVNLDEDNKDIEYWKKKALMLQKIRGDMEYWITNAERLLDLVDYIYDDCVKDEEWKEPRRNVNGGFYIKSVSGNR